MVRRSSGRAVVAKTRSIKVRGAGPSAGGLVCLPPPRIRLPLVYTGAAYAVSDDGRVIAGALSFGLDSESVIWIDRVPDYLKDYLRANGVPSAFEDWVNTGFVLGMSRDGRVLVGDLCWPAGFHRICRDTSAARRCTMMRTIIAGVIAALIASTGCRAIHRARHDGRLYPGSVTGSTRSRTGRRQSRRWRDLLDQRGSVF